MHTLILLIIFLCIHTPVSGQSSGQPVYPQWPQLQYVNKNLGWIVNDRTVVGSITRVPLYGGQDPFPFCAALTASILHDQHECMSNGRDCSIQPRTSGLSLVLASQSSEKVINWDNGGSTILAIGKIIKDGGAASHSACNYDGIPNPRLRKSGIMTEIFGFYMRYHSHRPYGGYMPRYLQSEFLLGIKDFGLGRPGLESLLTQKLGNSNELFSEIALVEGCREVAIPSSKTYKMINVENGNFNIGLSHSLITNRLRNKTPVALSLCLNVLVGFNQCSKHALVIHAESFARNTITGDVRKVYRVANTWGEDWHDKHGDGWVFADMLLLGVYEIIWLT